LHSTIFINLQGGVIQNILATDDLIETNIVVIDYDTDGIEDFKLSSINKDQAVVYKHPVSSINDGDIEVLENLLK
jgi:hypothetical protein